MKEAPQRKYKVGDTVGYKMVKNTAGADLYKTRRRCNIKTVCNVRHKKIYTGYKRKNNIL